MKKLSLVLASLVCISMLKAQQLQRIWATDTTLKVPESVYFDQKYQRLFVSNIDGKSAWDKDSKGSISLVTLSGKILNPNWITGLHAPKGMTMFQDFLIVADVDSVVIIDIIRGKIVKKIYVEGAQGLNDITSDKRGNMYVVDSKTKKIHYIDATKLEVKMHLSDLSAPNGILYSDKTLYFLDAGALYKLGKDKERIKIADGMEGNTDGLVRVDETTFIVSCWAGAVWHVKTTGEKKLLLDTREVGINAADLGYDEEKKILYVPAFWKNYITAYQLTQ
jgi:sugar lactone lactonase YvrE